MSEVLPNSIPKEKLTAEVSWMAGSAVASCPQCKRLFLLPIQAENPLCPLCHGAALTSQAGYVRKEAPEAIIPLGLKSAALQKILADFLAKTPYPEADLSVEKLMSRASVVYWPLWLVDADLKGEWTATLGFDYQVKTAKESFGHQGWQSLESLRTQTNFEPRLGYLDRHYDNLAVAALRNQQKRFEQIGTYEMKESVAYQSDMLASNSLQLPEIEPQELLDVAKSRLTRLAEKEIIQAAAAQHHQNVQFNGDYLNLNWTQMLMPLVSTNYQDEKGKVQTLVINGQSGKVYGRRLASMEKAKKWTLGLMLIPLFFLLVGLILVLSGAWELGSLAFPGLILLLLIGLALTPVIRANRWNRKERAMEEFE